MIGLGKVFVLLVILPMFTVFLLGALAGALFSRR